MSIYWNHFSISFVNNSGVTWDYTGTTPQDGSVQTYANVPPAITPDAVLAFVARSSSDSTSGASGTATWASQNGVALSVLYDAPNTGDPSASATFGNQPNRKNFAISPLPVTTDDLPCSGSGCPINSGYRAYALTLTLSQA